MYMYQGSRVWVIESKSDFTTVEHYFNPKSKTFKVETNKIEYFTDSDNIKYYGQIGTVTIGSHVIFDDKVMILTFMEGEATDSVRKVVLVHDETYHFTWLHKLILAIRKN